MTKERAAEILHEAPGLIAYLPADGARPAEVCLDGWFRADILCALAWWIENCPHEDLWSGDGEDPDAAVPPALRIHLVSAALAAYHARSDGSSPAAVS